MDFAGSTYPISTSFKSYILHTDLSIRCTQALSVMRTFGIAGPVSNYLKEIFFRRTFVFLSQKL